MQAYNAILRNANFITNVMYLDLIISCNRIKMDPKKITAIKN